MTFIPFFFGMLVAFLLVLIVSHIRPKHKCKEFTPSPWHWGTNPPAPGKQVLCFSPRYGRFVARYIPAHVHGFTFDQNDLPEDEVLIWCDMPELKSPDEEK